MKRINITITNEHHELAKRQSKEMFGNENVSRMVQHWIMNHVSTKSLYSKESLQYPLTEKESIKDISKEEVKKKEGVVVIPQIKEEDKSNVVLGNKTQYTFSGKKNRTCRYVDTKGIEHFVEVTDSMIETGKIKGVSVGSFRSHPDSRAYYCVMEYLKQYQAW